MHRAYKRTIFLLVCMLAYALTLQHIVITQNFIRASIGIIITLTLTNIATFSQYTHYQHYQRRSTLIAVVSIIRAIINQAHNTDYLYIIVAVISIHIGYLRYLRSKKIYKKNIIAPYTRDFTTQGTYIISITIALAVAMITIGIARSLPFDCNTIYQNTPSSTANTTDEAVQTQSIGPEQNSQNAEQVVEHLREDLEQTIQSYNQEYIQPILSQRTQLNLQICENIYASIQEQLQKPSVQLATIIPLFLILSPLLSIIIYITASISRLIIQIGKKIGLYQKKENNKIIEERY